MLLKNAHKLNTNLLNNKDSYRMYYHGDEIKDDNSLYWHSMIGYGRTEEHKDPEFYITTNKKDKKRALNFLIPPKFVPFFNFFFSQFDKHRRYSANSQYSNTEEFANEFIKHLCTFFGEAIKKQQKILEFVKLEIEELPEIFILNVKPDLNKTDDMSAINQFMKKVKIYFSLQKLESLLSSAPENHTELEFKVTKELRNLSTYLSDFREEDNTHFFEYIQSKLDPLINAAKLKLKEQIKKQQWDEELKKKTEKDIDAVFKCSEDNFMKINQLFSIVAINNAKFIEQGKKLDSIYTELQKINALHVNIPDELGRVIDFSSKQKKLNELLSLYNEKVKNFSLIDKNGKFNLVETLQEETTELKNKYLNERASLILSINKRLQEKYAEFKKSVNEAAPVGTTEEKAKTLLLNKIEELQPDDFDHLDKKIADNYIQIEKKVDDFRFLCEERLNQKQLSEVSLSNLFLKRQEQIADLDLDIKEKEKKLEELKDGLEKLKLEIRPYADSNSFHSLRQVLDGALKRADELKEILREVSSQGGLSLAEEELNFIQKALHCHRNELQQLQQKELKEFMVKFGNTKPALTTKVGKLKSKIEKLKNIAKKERKEGLTAKKIAILSDIKAKCLALFDIIQAPQANVTGVRDTLKALLTIVDDPDNINTLARHRHLLTLWKPKTESVGIINKLKRHLDYLSRNLPNYELYSNGGFYEYSREFRQ